jgi:hypothetical protein
MSVKLSFARLTSEGAMERADRVTSTDSLPYVLREWQKPVDDALTNAGLPALAQRKVLAHLQALYNELGQPPPATARYLREVLNSFERASNRILQLPELADLLRYVIKTEPTPDGEPMYEMVDPMANVRCSLEAALSGARRQKRSHGVSGRRISPTTAAVYALVDLVIEIEPSIKRAALTEFVATVLALPIGTFNLKKRIRVREPRWGERVGEALTRRKHAKA